MRKLAMKLVPALAGLSLACTLAGTPVPLVSHGDPWLFHKGTNAPQSDWKTVADNALEAMQWSSGRGGFGYATGGGKETNNCYTSILDAHDHYTTLYVRHQFTVTNDLPLGHHVYLRMDWDDGFIAWLDGHYLVSRNVSGAPTEPGYGASANADHESSLGGSGAQPAQSFEVGSVTNWLQPGTHTLAIMGLNNGSDSSDFILVADLYAEDPPPPPLAVTNTWYASNSPIVLNSNVTISNLSTLVIQPGTVLHLGSDVDFLVEDGGCLLAEGTTEAPIHFIRSNSSADPWGQMVISGSVGSPESRLTHVYFEGNGSSPCLEVEAGTVYLDHVTFGNTDRPYLALDGASFLITDCYFPRATASFESVHGTQGIKEGGRGILRNCFFGAVTGYNDTIDFTGGSRPGPILQVYNCVFMGSGDDNLDLDSADAWVEGNIFLHVHKNGSPDTASAVSGGDDYGKGDVTIIRNLFYDIDQVAMCKEGNFYTLINNTVVRQTHLGGLDTAGALICLQDNDMTEGRGMYLEGNIGYDLEALVRDAVTSTNTFINNLLSLVWSGPGGGNSTNDPLLIHIPELSETYFTNWAEAQIMKQWLALRPGSPAIGTGPNGSDKGAMIPLGVSISGEPSDFTTNTSATLWVGVNRTGHGIPASNWPQGAGYTHYRWRLDTHAWSAEIPVSTPVALTNLSAGSHYVEVIGKNDAGVYQNDPALGSNATITTSRTWTVQAANPLRFSSIEVQRNTCVLTFLAEAGQTYGVQKAETLVATAWVTFKEIPASTTNTTVEILDPIKTEQSLCVYRLVRP